MLLVGEPRPMSSPRKRLVLTVSFRLSQVAPALSLRATPPSLPTHTRVSGPSDGCVEGLNTIACSSQWILLSLTALNGPAPPLLE